MEKYLIALITEKGQSIETEIEIEGHIGLTYEVLIEFLVSLPKHMQDAIRKNLVMIDFKAGDVFDYLKHLTKGMIKAAGY